MHVHVHECIMERFFLSLGDTLVRKTNFLGNSLAANLTNSMNALKLNLSV